MKEKFEITHRDGKRMVDEIRSPVIQEMKRLKTGILIWTPFMNDSQALVIQILNIMKSYVRTQFNRHFCCVNNPRFIKLQYANESHQNDFDINKSFYYYERFSKVRSLTPH